jgi:hypothetical protein
MAFGLVILFIYWPLIHTGFIIGDPQLIWFSSKNSIYHILFNPSTNMYFYPPLFTPMLSLSLKIDSFLFKTNPTGYNFHSFLSLFLTASMFYVFLQLYLSKPFAFCGTILFILNPATIATTSWLSTRHYIEGMFWALLSIYLLKSYDKGKGKLHYILSGITYLLASFNKEVYVILPAAAFLILRGNIYERFKKTLPLWIGLLIYIPYRLYMLGGHMGGYSDSVWTIKEITQNFGNLPYVTLNMLFGRFWLVGVIFFIGLTIGFLLKNRELYSCITTFVFYSVITIPVIILVSPKVWFTDKMTFRYIFHITTFLIIIGTIGLFLLYKKKFLHAISISLIFFSLLGLWYYRGIEVRDLYKKYRDDTMRDVVQLVEHRNDKFFISNAPRLYNLNWYFNGIKKMYKYFYNVNIDTKVVFLESLKFNTPELIQEVLNNINIDNSAKKRLSEEISEFQSNLKQGPVTIDVSLDGYWFYWYFGPPEKGYFALLYRRADELYSNINYAPYKGRYHFASEFAGPLYFRVLYKTVDNKDILSPEFMIDLPSKRKITYKS